MSEQLMVKRAKAACVPCRERKRKCDGNEPCTTCRQSDYDCHYDRHRRKKRHGRDVEDDLAIAGRRTGGQGSHYPTSVQSGHMQQRSLEANSGAVLARTSGATIDAIREPQLQLFAWNLGGRCEPFPNRSMLVSITHTLTQMDMETLATVYFKEIHPVFGFLDRDSIISHIATRWLPNDADHSYDSVLCGVAALGCLFSKRSVSLEVQLVEFARVALEPSTLLPFPSVDDVTAWLLRVIYLRLTASPHATWMATCTMMHVLEAAGLHFDTSNDSVLARTVHMGTSEIRRKTYFVAQLLNIWVSFDYGRSRVEIRGVTCQLPAVDAKGITADLIKIYLVSETLALDTPREPSELEEALRQVQNLVPAHPMLVLIQCNVMLCIYRRLRAIGSNLSTENLDRMLTLMAHALDAVQELLETERPWWHVANVTFQAVCALLSIDTRSSLPPLLKSIQTMKSICSHYETETMREAYTAARALVGAHRKRKEQDLAKLDEVLQQCVPIIYQKDDPATQSYDDQLFSAVPGGPNSTTADLYELEWVQLLDVYSLQDPYLGFQ